MAYQVEDWGSRQGSAAAPESLGSSTASTPIERKNLSLWLIGGYGCEEETEETLTAALNVTEEARRRRTLRRKTARAVDVCWSREEERIGERRRKAWVSFDLGLK